MNVSLEYGISSFVYRSKKPFHAERFWAYVQQKFPNTVIRSKGLFWISSRPNQAMSWGQAGGSLRADSAGVWWSSMSFEQRTRYASFIDNQELIESGWHESFGDRKNEIVFIGQDMDEEKIISDLADCLLSDEEVISNEWREPKEDDWPVHRARPLD